MDEYIESDELRTLVVRIKEKRARYSAKGHSTSRKIKFQNTRYMPADAYAVTAEEAHRQPPARPVPAAEGAHRQPPARPVPAAKEAHQQPPARPVPTAEGAHRLPPDRPVPAAEGAHRLPPARPVPAAEGAHRPPSARPVPAINLYEDYNGENNRRRAIPVESEDEDWDLPFPPPPEMKSTSELAREAYEVYLASAERARNLETKMEQCMDNFLSM